MKKMGIFEAKTKFPALCTEVARTGLPVLVERRGRPLVMVAPLTMRSDSHPEDIHAAWKRWKDDGGRHGADFPEVWKIRRNRSAPPGVKP